MFQDVDALQYSTKRPNAEPCKHKAANPATATTLLYVKGMLLQLSVQTPHGLVPRSNAQTPFVLISETELLMPPSQLTNSPI